MSMLHVHVIYAIPHSSPFYLIVSFHVGEGICGSANSEVSVDDKLASSWSTEASNNGGFR